MLNFGVGSSWGILLSKKSVSGVITSEDLLDPAAAHDDIVKLNLSPAEDSG